MLRDQTASTLREASAGLSRRTVKVSAVAPPVPSACEGRSAVKVMTGASTRFGSASAAKVPLAKEKNSTPVTSSLATEPSLSARTKPPATATTR
jgi:hypothetical protein